MASATLAKEDPSLLESDYREFHMIHHHPIVSATPRRRFSLFAQHITWCTVSALMIGVLYRPCDSAYAQAVPPPLPISPVPLMAAIPGHPQIVLAVGNSQSMDGNVSGARMTGSGSLKGNLSSLNNTISPLDYTIPKGFTPPLRDRQN